MARSKSTRRFVAQAREVDLFYGIFPGESVRSLGESPSLATLIKRSQLQAQTCMTALEVDAFTADGALAALWAVNSLGTVTTFLS